MKRITNFSRKKIIIPASVKVFLSKVDSSYVLNTELEDLPELNADHDVAVRLRVRADSKIWRMYYLGTVDQIENLDNEEFPDVEEGRTKRVQCVLNLISESGSREILAYSKILTIKKFRYEEDEEVEGEAENNISLVTVDYDREGNLGDVPWKLEISNDDDEFPNLLLHLDFLAVELKQKIFAGAGVSQTLILVQIIKDVLAHLLINEQLSINEAENQEGWRKIWLLWAKEKSTSTYYESDDPTYKQNWIEELLSEFCRRNKLINNMKTELARI